ncbi:MULTISPECIES: hypothetical protein, partial [unclassified Mesorhizobium]|uniref:hypothetical protein n=1 Tax=unclassified Mesorhizobium TaxID=325217 RepID=UPI003014927F
MSFASYQEILKFQQSANPFVDLPLNFHPAAIRASAVFDPIPFFGPPEGGVSRLYPDGGLVA